MDEQVIHGKTVYVKKALPREIMAARETMKIYVGYIPLSITDEEFKSFFAGFGTVVDHVVMRHHSTGWSRGFGFVTFDSEQTVEDILAPGKMYVLGGQQLRIDKAGPRRAIQENPGGGYPVGRDGGYGASTGGYGGYESNYGGSGSAGGYGLIQFLPVDGGLYGGSAFRGGLVVAGYGSGVGGGYGGSLGYGSGSGYVAGMTGGYGDKTAGYGSMVYSGT